MPSCALRYCSNNTSKDNKCKGITFHRFPQQSGKRESWIKFVQKNRSEPTWLPTDRSVICCMHFKSEDKYITPSGRIFLRKTAIPYNQSPESSESKVEPISEPVSDSESIFDPPGKILLKKKLLKETTARKKLAEKIKKLRRQNRYLKRKCLGYKALVKSLKEKSDLSSEAENELHCNSAIIELCRAVLK